MFSQYADAPSAGLVEMHARTIVVLLLLTLSPAWSNAAKAADTSGALVLEREIPLDRVSGRIDHMAVDLERQRLAVAELGNNTVDLIDLNSGRAIHRISGLHEPQGIAFVPASDLLAVASAGDGLVTLFHASDFSPAGTINLGDDADNVRVDPKTGNLVIGYGEGGLAVIDSKTHAKIGDIALGAHPEGFQLTPDGDGAYVNMPDAREIAVVELAGGKQTASWRIADLQSNFPMALDGTAQRLAIVFRDPARLALLNAADGTLIDSVGTCRDADDVFFDERRGRIYVSCGAGAVDVFGINDLRHIAQVKTHGGARTSLFVPALDRLFVASRASWLGDDAKILVFRPSS
jgi:DNA-binding beta-propeller fold protein YncE